MPLPRQKGGPDLAPLLTRALAKLAEIRDDGGMLLRVGLIMMAFSVLLVVVVTVALVMSLRAPVPAVQASQLDPLSVETKAAQWGKNKFDPGKKLEIDDEPRQGEPEPRSAPAPQSGKSASSTASPKNPAPWRRGPDLRPVSNAGWQLPTKEELSQVNKPRYFESASDAVMTLTIDTLGIHDVPVFNSIKEEDLERGVVHVPDTAYPWDKEKQKNVFIAGHRVGFSEANSRMVFFNLNELKSGDDILLKDRSGNDYKYRVKELFKVHPQDTWVTGTLKDQDLLTLQTCTYPDLQDRLIVRAERA